MPLQSTCPLFPMAPRLPVALSQQATARFWLWLKRDIISRPSRRKSWPSYLHNQCNNSKCNHPNPPQAAKGKYSCCGRLKGDRACTGTYYVSLEATLQLMKQHKIKVKREEMLRAQGRRENGMGNGTSSRASGGYEKALPPVPLVEELSQERKRTCVVEGMAQREYRAIRRTGTLKTVVTGGHVKISTTAAKPKVERKDRVEKEHRTQLYVIQRSASPPLSRTNGPVPSPSLLAARQRGVSREKRRYYAMATAGGYF
ncbi:hypothetical protein FA15DRAFT_744947 [Coprinopsis marcescibilis]|uniref:Uncharacterized protein n=1 Tax=Coprinopsis marcescibilis TaxID=230819 RepID=A0A5C3KT40_COPMA|nr:hypothetical protein FA15DRAFT_744947 [Coprinopsis marcescibilis]